MSAIMTDVDARRRWCPFTRTAMADTSGSLVHNLPAANRWQTDGKGDTVFPASSLCVASDSMAWRKRVSAHARDQRDMDDERIGKFEAGGYCGLAGRPE